MTTQKPVSKNKDVIPSAYHISNPDYVGYISIGADLFYTDYFKTKEEAAFALDKLAASLMIFLSGTILLEKLQFHKSKII